MGMDSRNAMDKSMLSPEARQKFDELVALMVAEEYGPNGPPVETTFSEIEHFAHQAGQLVARSVSGHATGEHADHLGESSCPVCGTQVEADPAKATKTRLLQTEDGPVPLAEPVFHCPSCARDFFPSAARVGD